MKSELIVNEETAKKLKLICPACNFNFLSVFKMQDSADTFKPGAVGVCTSCGAILITLEDSSFHKLTGEEAVELMKTSPLEFFAMIRHATYVHKQYLRKKLQAN